MNVSAKRVVAILVAGAVAALIAWWLVAAFAPGGETTIAVGLGAIIGILSASIAGTIVEALVLTILFAGSVTVGLVLLGQIGAELTMVRTIALSLCAGACAGQLTGAAYNDFLAPPRR